MREAILVFGATSAIAHAINRLYAGQSATFVLVGRDEEKLIANAKDLRARGAAKVVTLTADFIDLGQHAHLVAAAMAELERLDVVVIAHGMLPAQAGWETDPEQLRVAIDTNFTSVASLANAASRPLAAQRSGSLVVIGSVAGDRGRVANYLYGGAKAGIAVFLQGLRARLRPQGVHVLTVKPGLVDTPMTAGFSKGLLWAAPERVAAATRAAIAHRRDVVYIPWFWRPIMAVIRALPSAILERLKI